MVVSDWRFGRKEKRYELNRFSHVRLAIEELNPSPTKNRRHRMVLVQMIRLMARDTKEQASLEIGCLDKSQGTRALELAQQIANSLRLKLKVEQEGKISLSPDEQAQLEDLESESDE